MAPKKSGDLDQRQAKNAEMASLDAAEQMQARPLELVASGAPESGVANHIQIGVNLRGSEGPDMKFGAGEMVPDPLAVAKYHRRRMKPVRRA